MINTSNGDARRIVDEMSQYMKREGISFRTINLDDPSPYAVISGGSSIGYRKQSRNWDKTGIVFFCTQTDAYNLKNELSLELEHNTQKSRPFAVFIPDVDFEEAVRVLKSNPLNNEIPNEKSTKPRSKKNGSYQSMFWDEYFPFLKQCLARDGKKNTDSTTETRARDTFYLERHDVRDFLSWFEDEKTLSDAKNRMVELLEASSRQHSNLKSDIKSYTEDLDYFAEFRGLDFVRKNRDDNSKYEFIKNLGNKENVSLVRDKESGTLYVKKEYTLYNRSVFDTLQNAEIEGLPKLYEVNEFGGTLQTLEEYIDGESLLEKLNRDGVFSEDEIKNVAISICMALKRLHSMKPILLHRDIKPSNIMVDKSGKIYLIDFNASREYRGNVSEDTELIGTQYFASPEQITGYHESTPASDIFSLGATLSYLMTGVYAKNHIADGKYHDVWAKCIEDSAKDRYQNVEEFIGALILAP